MSSKVKEKGEIRFRNYSQDLVISLPLHLEEVVGDNALAHLINKIVDDIALKSLEVYYLGTGCPPYHPKMLIKVWLYAYCSKVYTSRPLAKKLREDLVFMWLSGGQRPCFKTLSAFRSCRMKELVDEVFLTLLAYLVAHEYIDLSDLYLDGSKWEANANKHKITWAKNTNRYKEGVLDQIKDLLREFEELQKQEDAKYGANDLKEHQSPQAIQIVLNSADLENKMTHLNELIEQCNEKYKIKSLEKLHRDLSKQGVKLLKYEQQEQILGSRNSYSRTDEDATALRMKDERLLPGYNVQITTSDQFIVHASLHPNGSDSPTLIPHFEELNQRVMGLVTDSWKISYTADAGYGSEENYAFLQAKGHTAYVKYPSWYREVSGQLAKLPFSSANWEYNAEQDYYVCPNHQKLTFSEELIMTTDNGYDRQIRIYEAENCQGCPLWDNCRRASAKEGTNRTVQHSTQLAMYQQQASQRLASEEGLAKRSQRSVDVETPFANIKYNMGHRRFVLRGKDKVKVEFQLLAIAHNIKKVYCEQTGIWRDQYAHRAANSEKKAQRRA